MSFFLQILKLWKSLHPAAKTVDGTRTKCKDVPKVGRTGCAPSPLPTVVGSPRAAGPRGEGSPEPTSAEA